MTAAAKNTFGVVFSMAPSGSNPVAIAELNNVTPPSFSRATIDATTHDGSEAMEFISDGVYDPGEITIEGNLIGDSTDDLAFIEAIETGELQDWSIIFKAASGTAERSGSGYVTAYTLGDMPVQGGKQSFTATIKVSGAIAGTPTPTPTPTP